MSSYWLLSFCQIRSLWKKFGNPGLKWSTHTKLCKLCGVAIVWMFCQSKQLNKQEILSWFRHPLTVPPIPQGLFSWQLYSLYEIIFNWFAKITSELWILHAYSFSDKGLTRRWLLWLSPFFFFSKASRSQWSTKWNWEFLYQMTSLYSLSQWLNSCQV